MILIVHASTILGEAHTEDGLDVLGEHALVAVAGGVAGVQHRQEVGEGDVGTRRAAFPHLGQEAAAGGLGDVERGRAVGNGLAEEALATGERIGAGVDPDPE
jgi:hypothetical protein